MEENNEKINKPAFLVNTIAYLSSNPSSDDPESDDDSGDPEEERFPEIEFEAIMRSYFSEGVSESMAYPFQTFRVRTTKTKEVKEHDRSTQVFEKELLVSPLPLVPSPPGLVYRYLQRLNGRGFDEGISMDPLPISVCICLNGPRSLSKRRYTTLHRNMTQEIVSTPCDSFVPFQYKVITRFWDYKWSQTYKYSKGKFVRRKNLTKGCVVEFSRVFSFYKRLKRYDREHNCNYADHFRLANESDSEDTFFGAWTEVDGDRQHPPHTPMRGLKLQSCEDHKASPHTPVRSMKPQSDGDDIDSDKLIFRTQVPYGLLRNALKNSVESKECYRALTRQFSTVYLSLVDVDTLDFNGIYSAYHRIHESYRSTGCLPPKVMTTGYEFSDNEKDLESCDERVIALRRPLRLSSQLDRLFRVRFAAHSPGAVYYPEPNLCVRVDSYEDLEELSFDDLDTSESPSLLRKLFAEGKLNESNALVFADDSPIITATPTRVAANKVNSFSEPMKERGTPTVDDVRLLKSVKNSHCSPLIMSRYVIMNGAYNVKDEAMLSKIISQILPLYLNGNENKSERKKLLAELKELLLTTHLKGEEAGEEAYTNLEKSMKEASAVVTEMQTELLQGNEVQSPSRRLRPRGEAPPPPRGVTPRMLFEPDEGLQHADESAADRLTQSLRTLTLQQRDDEGEQQRPPVPSVLPDSDQVASKESHR